MIDWGLVADVLGAAAGLIAAVVAAWAALKAYPDWLKRQTYQRKSERAEQILASFYECRRSINSVRSVIQFATEVAEAVQTLKDNGVEIENDNTPLVTAQVQMTRMNKERAVWDKLINVIPFASVNFGEKVEKALEEALRVRQEFVSAASTYPNADGELLTNLRQKLFHNDPDDMEDDFNRRLRESEETLYANLSKYIEAE